MNAIPVTDRIARQLDLGIQHHQSGHLHEAEVCYQKVLKLQQTHPEAWHLLGTIACQQGQYALAVVQISRAIELQPNKALLYCGLGNAYQEQGQFKQAIECYQKAIQLEPDYHAVHIHLETLLDDLKRLKESRQTEPHIQTENAEYSELQQPLEIASNPSATDTKAIKKQFATGLKLQKSGQLQEAEICYQQVLRWQPNHAEAWYLMGTIAAQQGLSAIAIKRLNRAIELQPEKAILYYTLAKVYQQEGNSKKSIEYYQKSLQLNPNFAEAYNSLGNVYVIADRLDDAIQCFQRALQINSNHFAACNNLGLALKRQDRLGEAIEAFEKALKLYPNKDKVYINLGSALRDRAQIKEAIEFFQKALQLNPALSSAHSKLLLMLHYDGSYQPSTIYAEHLNWAECHAAPLAKLIESHNYDLNPERRLRIGYVSSDLREHSVAFFFESVLAARKHNEFEVICYSNNTKIDTTTRRFQQLSDGWREIYAMNDEQVAEQIRRDEIDILVDLSGHTGGNRLLVFARKPAPIQVSYLGYPDTTGLDTMDYRLTDEWADPEGQTDRLYTEKLVRLPHGFLCYRPKSDCPAVGDSPFLNRGQVTFTSFNNLPKVTPQTIGTWAAILKAVPNSCLLIKAKSLTDSSTRAYIHGLFKQQGIEVERVELIGWIAERNQHLALYNRVDIALDTFPYHGTTTTCEAMWMGVPVITLAGQTHVSRVGVSLLSSVGLEELIAESPEDYIQKAIDLARDRERLQDLRASLRNRLRNSPLTNQSLICHSLEESYRNMWHQYCND